MNVKTERMIVADLQEVRNIFQRIQNRTVAEPVEEQ